MPIFKKEKGVDVLDFTTLQKKGILNIPEKNVEMPVRVNSQGYVDLGVSAAPSPSVASEGIPSYSSGGGVSALGFLDSLASSAAASSSEPVSVSGDNLEIQGLKNKIEDLEYKIRVLEDKISRLG